MIREYKPEDLEALFEMYRAQGFSYAFPNLADPLFFSKLVLENGSGRPNMAVLGRLTGEIYLLLDPAKGTPRERWEWFTEIHRAAELDCWRKGLDDVTVWLPPSIAKSFGRRLESLGWVRDTEWPCYSKFLAGPVEVENGTGTVKGNADATQSATGDHRPDTARGARGARESSGTDGSPVHEDAG